MLKAKWLEKGEIVRGDGLLLYANSWKSIFDSSEGGIGAHLIGQSNLGDMLLPGAECSLRLLFYGFSTFDGKISVKELLRGNSESGNARHVYEFVGADSGLSIRAGITIHDTGGAWSSWPMHEFETNAMSAPVDLDPDFHELFAFVTSPPGMWGIQCGTEATCRNHTAGNLGVLAFRDRDINAVALGSHPVVAAPGVRLAYFWCYQSPLNLIGAIEKFV